MPLFNLFSGKVDQGQEKLHFLFQQKRCCSRDHYQVLGVERSASSKEIRKSFIELSKQLHPDINKDPKTHDKFVKLNEAYSTLIKPSNRRDYDQTIAFRVRAKQREASTVTPHTYGSSHRPGTDFDGSEEGQFYYDETLWHFRDRTKDKFYEEEAQRRPPTGAWKFLSRLSNVKIVVGCFGVMVLGGMLHYYTYYASSGWHQESLNDRDRKLAAYHTDAKEQAKPDRKWQPARAQQSGTHIVWNTTVPNASCKVMDTGLMSRRRQALRQRGATGSFTSNSSSK